MRKRNASADRAGGPKRPVLFVTLRQRWAELTSKKLLCGCGDRRDMRSMAALIVSHRSIYPGCGNPPDGGRRSHARNISAKSACAISALCVLSCSAARANACLDAFTKYKRIVNAVDAWYISAYERTTGVSFASDVPRQPCKVMLPLYRERLRRQRAVTGQTMPGDVPVLPAITWISAISTRSRCFRRRSWRRKSPHRSGGASKTLCRPLQRALRASRPDAADTTIDPGDAFRIAEHFGQPDPPELAAAFSTPACGPESGMRRRIFHGLD